MTDEEELAPAELLAWLAQGEVEVGRYVSVEAGRAAVELVGPDGTRWVTVVDREP